MCSNNAMTINEPNKSRSKVDSEVVQARLERPLLDALDAWTAAQPEPKPTRDEAIRRLVAEALGKAGGGETIGGEELNASNDE